MSVNHPPNPNVATFNNLYWISADTGLTTATGDLRYLKFPVAQGTENLQTTNVNGVLTCNNNVIVNNKSLDIDGALGQIRYADNTFQNTAYTGGTAGTYTATNMTIDANGKISAISNGAAPVNLLPLNNTWTGTQLWNNTSSGALKSNATQPLATDNTNNVPTTAWVQTAISAGVTPNLLPLNNTWTGTQLWNAAATFNAAADFNTTVNVDGILTTTNSIDMTGTSTATNNIATRQLSLKDATNGNSNGSSILTNTNVLTIDSVGPNATNTSINFALRNTANAVITPLQLTTTVNNMNVPLDMTGGSSILSSVRSRVYSFRDVNTGAITTSRSYQDLSNIVIDAAENNSAINFQTKTSGGTVVFPLSVQSSQITSNVALDMTNTGSYTDAIVKSRLFGLRDLTTSANTSCGMYFSSNILQIDSNSGSASTASSMFLRTTKTDGTLTNALQLTNTTVKTDCPNPSTADNTNTLATTSWVQSVLTTNVLPAYSLRRAWKSGNSTGGGGNSGCDIIISDCGTTSTTWSQNETLTLRISLHQQWANRGTYPTDSTLYQTVYANVTLYPWRFTNGWLNDGGGPQGAPRGEINQNGIYATGGLKTSFAPQDATYFPNGRQFWCDQLNWAYNTGTSAPVGRLYICGISGNVNGVRFIVSNPYGFNTSPSGTLGTYSFNISAELLNAGDTGATITTSNFNVNF